MSRLFAIFLVVGIVAGSTGQPVFAQATRLGPRAPAEIKGDDLAAAEKAVSQFGVCTLRRVPREVQALLDVPVDDPRYQERLSDVASSECLMEGSIQIPPEILRGSLFEALYRAKYLRFDKPLAQVSYDYAAGYKTPLSNKALNALSLLSVGDCVVRADPAAARNFILNDSTSAIGSGAFAVIVSKLPPCVPQGLQVHFSRPIIRAAIAEALYRLTSQAAGMSVE